MKNKWLKIGLGTTVASVIAAGTIFVAAPALAQTSLAAGNSTASTSTQLQRPGGPGGMMRGAAHQAEVAKALNMTEDELRTEVESGKSIAEIASAKGVSLDTIVNAIITAETEQLKQAVTDGRFTQAQADTIIANLKLTLPSQLQTKWVGMPKGDPTQGGLRGGRGGMGAQMTTVAKALGLSEDELRTELQAGKSISDVASAKGVALSSVVDAVVAEQSTSLKQAVTDGKLTQAQADEWMAALKENLPKLFEQKGGFGRPGFGGPGQGQRGPRQQNQNGAPSTPSTPSMTNTPDNSL